MRTGSSSEGLSGRKSICNPLHEVGLNISLCLSPARLGAEAPGLIRIKAFFVASDAAVVLAVNRNCGI